MTSHTSRVRSKNVLRDEYVWAFIGALASHERVSRDSSEGFIRARGASITLEELCRKHPEQAQMLNSMLPMIINAVNRHTPVMNEDETLKGVTLSERSLKRIWGQWSKKYMAEDIAKMQAGTIPLAESQEPELRKSLAKTANKHGIGADDIDIVPDPDAADSTRKYMVMKGIIFEAFSECLRAQQQNRSSSR